MDALRLIVVFGICLWMVPVLWPDGSNEAIGAFAMSRALFYVFGVWFFLIVASAFLARRGIYDATRSETESEEE